MIISGRTDPGKVRPVNEDSYLTMTNRHNDTLAVVCDGIGGSAAGEEASRIAVRTLGDAFRKGPEFSHDYEVDSWLREVLHKANDQIYNRSMKSKKVRGMGTTAVGVLICRLGTYIFNVGDSRLYAFYDDGLTQMTEDHSVIAQLVRENRITPEEARTHSQRNTLTNALGVWRVFRIDVDKIESTWKQLLVCSDGLHGYVPQEEIEKVIQDPIFTPDQKSRILVERANEAGGLDNVTVILLEQEPVFEHRLEKETRRGERFSVLIKEVANRYTIIALIGQGGMADVYKAFDTILNRIVAVKVLRSKLSDDPMTLVRFQREAYAASKLSHPNIIDIYDVGEADGLHYIVMEFVRGRTLKQLVAQRGALDVPEAVAIMKQLTSAVSHAHEHHIIHRDIKPQNVLIKDDGTVKITDFGIAVANDSVQLTWNNAVMGSAHYLAPEQAQGKEPDPKIDIYSLGIVFYELLTGDVPFKGASPTEIAVQHLRSELPSCRKFNPDIPQAVENIVIRAAAKDPAERYATARDMVQDLNTCLSPARAQEAPLHLKTVTLDLKGRNEPRPKPAGTKKKALSRAKGIGMGILAGVVLFLLVLFAGSATGLLRIPGFLGYQTMPSTLGQTQDEALATLADASFDPDRVTFEYKVDDSLEKGRVISQSVNAGRVVAQDSPLVLTLSKGPSFLIPDYTGGTLEDVREDLEAHGVNVVLDVVYRGEPNTNPGIVLEQNELIPGSRVDPEEQNHMTLVISEYPSITISPELIGMDVDAAKRLLNDQGAAVITRQQYGQGTTVVRVDPPVGSVYTQEGTDSVITLYY